MAYFIGRYISADMVLALLDRVATVVQRAMEIDASVAEWRIEY